jgi:hypothetical protein
MIAITITIAHARPTRRDSDRIGVTVREGNRRSGRSRGTLER